MCQVNNASMEETYKAEVECLRKVLAEKDAKIKHLEDLLDNALAELDKYIQGARQ
jgi:hypothetical protein